FLLKKWLAISIIKGNRQETESRIGPHFIITISTLIIIFLTSSFQYKKFIIEKYGIETQATVLHIEPGKILMGYTTLEGEYIKKAYVLEKFSYYNPVVLDKLLIKYASVNPRVCKV